MANADNLDVFLLTTEELANSFCLSLDGAGRCLLNEDITILTMFEGEEDEVNGFVTYDRRVEKLPEALMQAIARDLKGD